MLDGIINPIGEPPPLLVLADIEEVLDQFSTISFSNDGTMRMKRSYSSSVQKPITRSTPARLY
jgi:hypothetical protein